MLLFLKTVPYSLKTKNQRTKENKPKQTNQQSGLRYESRATTFFNV